MSFLPHFFTSVVIAFSNPHRNYCQRPNFHFAVAIQSAESHCPQYNCSLVVPHNLLRHIWFFIHELLYHPSGKNRNQIRHQKRGNDFTGACAEVTYAKWKSSLLGSMHRHFKSMSVCSCERAMNKPVLMIRIQHVLFGLLVSNVGASTKWTSPNVLTFIPTYRSHFIP